MSPNIWITLCAGWLVIMTASDSWGVQDDQLTLGTEAADALRALAKAGQPDGVNGWPIFVEAGTRAREIDRAIPREEESIVHSGFYDWTVLTSTGLDDKYKRIALAGLARMRAGGVFEQIADASACSTFLRSFDADQEFIASPKHLSSLREVSRLLNATMSLAFQENRWDDACTELEHALTLACASGRQPQLLDSLVGLANYSAAINELRTCLAESHFPEEVTLRIMHSLADHPMPEVSIAIRGERITLNRLIEWVYRPDRGKGDRTTEETLKLFLHGTQLGGFFLRTKAEEVPPLGDAPPVDFATAAEMTDSADSMWLKLEAVQRLPPAERLAAFVALKAEISKLPDRVILTRMVAEAVVGMMRDQCRTQMYLDGLTIMLALELQFARHRAWPAALSELPAASRPESFIDCFTGQPFVYRVSQDGRNYLLYSIGADRKDNGGKLLTDDNYLALTESGEGFDYILNPPRSRHMNADDQPHDPK